MSRGLNKVTLIGHCGKDPEARTLPSGGAVTNVSLATSESWKDKGGEKQERTEWHNLVFYERIAEIAGQYLRKGSRCYVEGRIQTRKWQDKDGKDRYSTEIIVRDLMLLGDKPDGASTGGGASQAAPENPKAATARDKPAQFEDDDIPFIRTAGVGDV